MAGLVPAIHVFFSPRLSKTWMPGTSPGTTNERLMPGKVTEPHIYAITLASSDAAIRLTIAARSLPFGTGLCSSR
jgi:hypothetical protein